MRRTMRRVWEYCVNRSESDAIVVWVNEITVSE